MFSEFNKIFEETIPVEYIPAVLKGETQVEAKKRIRSIFVSINKHAKPPTQGEVAVLDDDNGFAVVARQASKESRIFESSKGKGGRINYINNNAQ